MPKVSLRAQRLAIALLFPGLGLAQQSAPSANSPFSRWGAEFRFLFDGYVNTNFNHPDSKCNEFRNFDMRADTAHFNIGMMTIERTPAPVGFHVDTGFGEVFHWIHTSDRAPQGLQYFKQAYLSVKPRSWKGVEIDAGEFVTSAGAEVIETNQNWNYSRSLLFAWAIPYYHFGMRASAPIGRFTGGVQLVQGWNKLYDNNSGKTIGISGAYQWKHVAWNHTYYAGPEKVRTNAGLRQLYDAVVAIDGIGNFSFYVNADYGRDKNIGPGASVWTGIAGAMRYSFSRRFGLAARTEWFEDRDGFATGTKQSMGEVTITGEYKPANWLVSRLEFRDDWSDRPVFERGSGSAKAQPTVVLGLVAFFGPKK